MIVNNLRYQNTPLFHGPLLPSYFHPLQYKRQVRADISSFLHSFGLLPDRCPGCAQSEVDLCGKDNMPVS